jgi:FkbM family methyltransferase
MEARNESTHNPAQTRRLAIGALDARPNILREVRALIRDAAKTIARSFGYDIRQIGSHRHKRPIDFIRARNIDLVVDIGANKGQYGTFLRKDGYAGWIVSLEPTSAAYETLAARASKDGRWKALNLAAGDKEGTVEINVSEASEFSSCHQQLPAAMAFDSKARVIRRETVRVVRLDDLFGELPPRKGAFLKIDTQGYEQQILMGTSKYLSGFLGVQMELPIVHLYEGTWRFHEAVFYMREHGFEISNLLPVNYDHDDQASLLELDCIFRNTRSWPPSQYRDKSQPNLIRESLLESTYR